MGFEFISVATSVVSALVALAAVLLTLFQHRTMARRSAESREMQERLLAPSIDRLSTLVGAAKHRVHVTESAPPMFRRLYPQLADAAARGLNVRVLLPDLARGEYARRSSQIQAEMRRALHELEEASRQGIEVRVFRSGTTTPSLVVDNSLVIVPYAYSMDRNLSGGSEGQAILATNDQDMSQQAAEAFESIWSESVEVAAQQPVAAGGATRQR